MQNKSEVLNQSEKDITQPLEEEYDEQKQNSTVDDS
eukprot:CAMPEP_0194441160 /NCGR_PEP_ID=MMETSP0176-20130528/120076_1 /TAXON_ID=216777 /ORGANISM="Proboscia alata, Strain PI-D3" /LENGTH=35 /DNA_ID= /DNA_START= /DNA_END= /DNA_ORIENTATION=